ncbi:MAG: Brp/Blh family beta-carotene 15,15'-dioxygenase [Cyclobacteriaceae bacterium]
MQHWSSTVPTNTLGDFYYGSVALVTLLVALLGFVFPQFLQQIELVLFTLIILMIGVPHGATDHLLDQFSKGKKFTYRTFLLTYIVLGVIYTVLWYFLPQLSLLVFIVISTYHFGQSQLLYLRMSQHHWLKIASYMLWGSYTLCCIILLNWDESWLILDELFPSLLVVILPYLDLIPYLLGLLFFTNVGLFVVFYAQGQMQKREFVGELINLGLIAALAYFTPLLVSFAIYFGLWHSLISVRIEIQKLRTYRRSFSAIKFAKTALPLSLSTLVIFVVIFLLNTQFALFQSPYLLFFILISVLTLPHVLYVQEFYTSTVHKQAVSQ